MTKKEKKEIMAQTVSKLKERYPDAKCSLENEGEACKLLEMGRLSAQCTDERVNIVCRDLFRAFPTAEEMAGAPLSEIEELIKSCGLYKMKAKNIKDASIRLINDYNGHLPDTMEELLKFEGVGRKIANLLLGDLFGKPAIVADTHCMRICGRLGMYRDGMKDPYKTEQILSEIVEPSEQSDLCHRLVLFGRDICTARSPKCNLCPLFAVCKKSSEFGIRSDAIASAECGVRNSE